MPYWGIFRFGGSLWIFAEVTCSRIDDSMLSDLRLIIHFDAIQGHVSVRMRFTDHEGVACLALFGEISSWSCMLIPTYEIHVDTMFPPWSLSGVTQLGLHFATPRCHHAFLPGDALLIYGSDSFRFPWLADNLMPEHSSSDGSERARNVNWFPVAVAAVEDADDGGVLSSPNSTVSFFR
ncbi:hypothetical protein VitviT2T_026339 [Vitis vinifera]|uniref:HD-ZIP protein N-terminal domain-containing protein n=1 Tax=Vitis vinifera TaxID=29760 RepID=A0ABY9DNL0_VITVI|nr:hypothetical protein VitviT2T_026339 [Vitis vinifera]